MMGSTLIAGLAISVVMFGPSLVTMGAEPDTAPDASAPAVARMAPAQTPSPPQPDDILVTVNGVPIREADVQLALSSVGHTQEAARQHPDDVLERIIEQELIRQRAVELGLDADTSFQEKLRRWEAQLRAFKRSELSGLYVRHQAAAGANVSDADAERFYAENAGRIRTELHLWQILRRDEASIASALAEIRAGTPFEEVAGKPFAGLPLPSPAPWDLGYLNWTQLPESWRSFADDLKVGEVSGVVRGPNHRYWIIKLINKRENPEHTFRTVKSTILDYLKNAGADERRRKAQEDLRADATIVYKLDRNRADGPARANLDAEPSPAP